MTEDKTYKITSLDYSDKIYRILSLDGGGIRGIVSARLLVEIEKYIKDITGQSILEYFDMIAGTSTGSILAASIALGYKPDDVVNLYKENGSKIFQKNKLLSIENLKHVIKYGILGPRYSNEGLINTLKKLPYFDTKIKDVCKINEEVKNTILIMSYDIMYRNTTFFTNNHQEQKSKWFDNIPIWELCIASASAPTYFPPYELIKKEKSDLLDEEWSFPHVDGGLTANNPALAAISHALELGIKLENIQILSISTGNTLKPISFTEAKKWGLLDWGFHIPDMFMDGQSEIQSKIAERLLGGKSSNRYLRLQFPLNDYFEKPSNILAQAKITPKNKRRNKLVNKYIHEDMDNPSTENINNLIDLTEAYILLGYINDNRFCHYGKVIDNIKEFILNPNGVRIRHDK